MEVVLRKYGNSTVLAFPPGVLKDLGLKAGQVLALDSSVAGKITLTPKRRYRLADLLSQCDANVPPPADLAAWDNTRPVGQEVW